MLLSVLSVFVCFLNKRYKANDAPDRAKEVLLFSCEKAYCSDGDPLTLPSTLRAILLSTVV